jgi:hypothetical protein
MQHVIVQVSDLEQAICANAEILTVLTELFRVHGIRPELGAAILRALNEFRAGLVGLRPQTPVTAFPLELAALDEARLSHDEIAWAVQQASELGRVPPELAEQIGATFEDYAVGLRRLGSVAAA